jgi:FAD synthetase
MYSTRTRYTSLGSIYNTFPNPALLVPDSVSSDMFPSSLTVVANNPSAMCIGETPAPRQPKAAEYNSLGGFTVIASNPESTCPAEPSIEPSMEPPKLTSGASSDDSALGSFCVIANDPSTTCFAEENLVNSNGHVKPPSQLTLYKPAYMLQDGSLERAGRVSAAALSGLV